MKSLRNSLRSSPLIPPLALLVICALTYVPLVYRLGFYWDDWPSIWFYHFWGPESFREGFSGDRPLLAWIFQLTTPIFGESMVGWQYFGIAMRWLTSLAWWWALRGLWIDRPNLAFWAAALLAVYPGFAQQYISVTYSNSFLVFFLFIVSIGSMIWAQRKSRWFWLLMALSVTTAALSILITEYFYGLELLRPALIWLALDRPERSRRQKVRSVLFRWAPYLAILLPFLFWRLFFTVSPRAEILLFSDLIRAPFTTIWALVRTISLDFWEVNFAAWYQGLNPAYLNDFETSVLRLLAGAVALSLLFTFAFLTWLRAKDPDVTAAEGDIPVRRARQSILLGVLAFLVSGWTIWITDLHFELLFPFDRFTLITMLGTSLLIAGMVGLLDRKPWVSSLVLALLVGLSTAIQFQHRLTYRQEWLSQKNFFWQLAWRAPAIQPGTLLMTSEIPFVYYSDNSLSAPLNWIYAAENPTKDMQYLLYDIEARMDAGLQELKSGSSIHMPYRAAEFSGSTSQAIVLFYDPPRCVKVMNPALDRFLPVKPLYIREAAPLSNPDLILASGGSQAVFPESIFGPPPAPNWCYYFEKAELHGQYGDWEKAAEMADAALKINKHFTEKNVSELIPFLMAYAYTGKWEKAVELSQTAYQIWDKTQYPLCDAWLSVRANTPESAARTNAFEEIQPILNCVFP